ncbi:MAG: hypothetical protein GX456_09260 [Verrucomicrobia bacterium]|nr:hypothetical protein [Verrucomicrobiota bacterium]
MRVGLFSVWALAALVATLSLNAAGQSPDFFEVYGLIKSNLVGVQQSELNQAAVEGLLDRLHGRVYFGTNGSSIATDAADQGTGIARTNLFAERFGYIRITNISSKTPPAFVELLDQLRGSNRLEGLALDLRFASGTDYAAAGQIADCFLSEARALIRLDQETINSTAKTNAFTRPVAVLVNSKTTGAAEALAAVLRETGVGLLIGSKTAGRANMFKEFTLSTGQKLFIATALVKLGSGDNIKADGLVPDIAVNIAPDEEMLYLQDPYRRTKSEPLIASQSSGETLRSTNRPAREADLVRMRREGSLILSEETSSKTPIPAESTITDPALARAVDLLKGLAVIQQQRPDSRRRPR